MRRFLHAAKPRNIVARFANASKPTGASSPRGENATRFLIHLAATRCSTRTQAATRQKMTGMGPPGTVAHRYPQNTRHITHPNNHHHAKLIAATTSRSPARPKNPAQLFRSSPDITTIELRSDTYLLSTAHTLLAPPVGLEPDTGGRGSMARSCRPTTNSAAAGGAGDDRTDCHTINVRGWTNDRMHRCQSSKARVATS
jgi:hypothetical protein